MYDNVTDCASVKLLHDEELRFPGKSKLNSLHAIIIMLL